MAEVLEAPVLAALIHASEVLEAALERDQAWNVLATDTESADKIAAELEAKQAQIKKVAALVARFDQGDDAAAALSDELDGLNVAANELRERPREGH